MGDLLAFGQGLVDAANNRVLENRKSRYELMLRDRELKDWKEKENFSSGIRLSEDETTRKREKERKDQEYEDKKRTGVAYLISQGYDPAVAEGFGDGLAREVFTYNDFLNKELKFAIDPKTGKPRVKEELDRDTRMQNAEAQADALGYSGPVKKAMVDYAMNNTDGVTGFLGKFVIKNGQIIPKEVAIGEANNAATIQAAGIRAGGADDVKPAAWHKLQVQDSVNSIIYTALSNAISGGIIKEKYEMDPETGKQIGMRYQSDNQYHNIWLGQVYDLAQRNAASRKYMDQNTGALAALRTVTAQLGTMEEFAENGGKPKAQATAPTATTTDTSQTVQTEQPVDSAMIKVTEDALLAIEKMPVENLKMLSKDDINDRLNKIVSKNPALKDKAREIAKRWKLSQMAR